MVLEITWRHRPFDLFDFRGNRHSTITRPADSAIVGRATAARADRVQSADESRTPAARRTDGRGRYARRTILLRTYRRCAKAAWAHSCSGVARSFHGLPP